MTQKVDIAKIKEIIGRCPARASSLIAVLQDIQRHFHYLPGEALKETAVALQVPLSKVYSVATFYNAFSLVPRGEHICRICMGTACHIKGAPIVLEQAEKMLGIKPGQTTADLKYSLEVVNCVGACALAPVMIVDKKYYANVRADKVKRFLDGA
jgi:NADH-quinone oxidoreductase subunit E